MRTYRHHIMERNADVTDPNVNRFNGSPLWTNKKLELEHTHIKLFSVVVLTNSE